jgi:hypothetical protein
VTGPEFSVATVLELLVSFCVSDVVVESLF